MNNPFFHQRIFNRAAFLLSCLLFWGCENDPKVIEQWTSNKVLVEEVKEVKIFMSQGGHMKARLDAPLMLRYQTDTVYVEFPHSLHVNFFDSLGNQDSHLDALYGKYYETLNKVYLRDSVTVFNDQGDSLHCLDLWWDQSKQRFYTDKNVRVRKSGNLIFGKGMEGRQDLSDINIREVTGTVPVPDSLQAQ